MTRHEDSDWVDVALDAHVSWGGGPSIGRQTQYILCDLHW